MGHRLAGEASDIKYLKQQMNKTKRLDVSTSPDINSIANLLKVSLYPFTPPPCDREFERSNVATH